MTKSSPPRHCSKCGEPGHQARTCRKNFEEAIGGPISVGGEKRVAISSKEYAILKTRSNRVKRGDEARDKTSLTVYQEMFADMPDPPDDPLERDVWLQGNLARLVKITLQGFGNREINQQVTTIASTISRITPRERLYEAEQLVRGDAIKSTKPKTRGQVQKEKVPVPPGGSLMG